jgi:hypothetical protein
MGLQAVYRLWLRQIITVFLITAPSDFLGDRYYLGAVTAERIVYCSSLLLQILVELEVLIIYFPQIHIRIAEWRAEKGLNDVRTSAGKLNARSSKRRCISST